MHTAQVSALPERHAFDFVHVIIKEVGSLVRLPPEMLVL